MPGDCLEQKKEVGGLLWPALPQTVWGNALTLVFLSREGKEGRTRGQESRFFQGQPQRLNLCLGSLETLAELIAWGPGAAENKEEKQSLVHRTPLCRGNLKISALGETGRQRICFQCSDPC